MLWSLIPDWLPLILGGAVAAIAAFLGGRWSGVKQGRQGAENDALRDNINTRKRMDEADIVGDDPDAARRWLSERSKR